MLVPEIALRTAQVILHTEGLVDDEAVLESHIWQTEADMARLTQRLVSVSQKRFWEQSRSSLQPGTQTPKSARLSRMRQ